MSFAREFAVYLDHHATTPVDPRVIQTITAALTSTFGNPNSTDHIFGAEAQALIATAHQHVADLTGTTAGNVQFTSGASEGLALALRHACAARDRDQTPLQVAATPVEHRALLDLLMQGEASKTLHVHWLSVDSQARLDLDEFQAALKHVDLACVMAANNEVGTIYPTEHLAGLAHDAGVSFLVDATQTAGREPLHADAWGITYTVLSAHKMYGPKGVGALMVPEAARRRAPEALERHGTPDAPLIAGLGEAARLRLLEMEFDEERIRDLRDALQRRLLDLIPGLVVNGDLSHRLSHNLHVSVLGIPNDAVTARLYDQVAISTGSACTSGAQEPSHVLQAMQLPLAVQEGALRLSPGKFTTASEIERAAVLIAGAITEVQQLLSVSA